MVLEEESEVQKTKRARESATAMSSRESGEAVGEKGSSSSSNTISYSS